MKITRKELTDAQQQVTPDMSVNDLLVRHEAICDKYGVVQGCSCGGKRDCPELRKKQLEIYNGPDMM